jgi:hypothetical protein
MKSAMVIIAVTSLGLVATAEAQNKSADNPGGCKVVQLKPGQQAPSGTLSSSVTAGGGRVSGSTTGGGNSVTVHSGSGGSASASSVTTTGSSGGSSTTVTTANGECTIYVNPGKK